MAILMVHFVWSFQPLSAGKFLIKYASWVIGHIKLTTCSHTILMSASKHNYIKDWSTELSSSSSPVCVCVSVHLNTTNRSHRQSLHFHMFMKTFGHFSTFQTGVNNVCVCSFFRLNFIIDYFYLECSEKKKTFITSFKCHSFDKLTQ